MLTPLKFQSGYSDIVSPIQSEMYFQAHEQLGGHPFSFTGFGDQPDSQTALLSRLYTKAAEQIRDRVFMDEITSHLGITEILSDGRKKIWEAFEALGRNALNHKGTEDQDWKIGWYRKCKDNPLELLRDYGWIYRPKTIWASNDGGLAHAALHLYPPRYMGFVRTSFMNGRISLTMLQDTLQEWSRTVSWQPLSYMFCALAVIMEDLPFPFAEQYLRELASMSDTVIGFAAEAAKKAIEIRGG